MQQTHSFRDIWGWGSVLFVPGHLANTDSPLLLKTNGTGTPGMQSHSTPPSKDRGDRTRVAVFCDLPNMHMHNWDHSEVVGAGYVRLWSWCSSTSWDIAERSGSRRSAVGRSRRPAYAGMNGGEVVRKGRDNNGGLIWLRNYRAAPLVADDAAGSWSPHSDLYLGGTS